MATDSAVLEPGSRPVCALPNPALRPALARPVPLLGLCAAEQSADAGPPRLGRVRRIPKLG
jgi:hypothetical protein